MTTTKHCRTCDTTKATTEFSKHKRMRDGLASQCKCCRTAKDKAHRQANAEAINARDKAYYQANAEALRTYYKTRYDSMTQVEAAAKASVAFARRRSDLPSADLYGGLTYTEACDMTLPFAELRLKLEQETGVAHQIDHIVAIANGGTHTADNLQVLTALENNSKGYKQ